MRAPDPGRVKTPKGRLQRGIVFCRPRFSEPSYPSLPGHWREEKEIVLLVVPAQTFLHGQDPKETSLSDARCDAAMIGANALRTGVLRSPPGQDLPNLGALTR